MNCDRDDHDGISKVALAKAIVNGWKHVDKVQAYEQACKVIDPGDDAIFDWWTHLGWCPDCEVM